MFTVAVLTILDYENGGVLMCLCSDVMSKMATSLFRSTENGLTVV
jgi:hypothetical protein